MPDRLMPVVLLVDDDPGDQELTRRALEDGAVKVDLHITRDGEQALAYLRHQAEYAGPDAAPRPDLVLLDLNMPRMDGRQVLEEIKGDDDLRRIPIVVMTTSKQEADILRSYELGCNTFVKKPLDVEEFIQSIRQLGLYWFGLAQLPSH